jgi:hypothetical protein
MQTERSHYYLSKIRKNRKKNLIEEIREQTATLKREKIGKLCLHGLKPMQEIAATK